MQEIINEIRQMKRRYEELKEEKFNNEIFREGKICKTDYIEYALNFGVSLGYPQDEFYNNIDIYIEAAISGGKMADLIQEVREINTSLESERDRMREINHSLFNFLFDSGKWNPFL